MKYEIGKKIREYREKQNLTQKEFAAQIGVGNSRVSNWEQGINRPDVNILADICRVLHVSPSELLEVNLSEKEITSFEIRLIENYRQRTDLQKAVKILLGMY